jgi:hypothetical protein
MAKGLPESSMRQINWLDKDATNHRGGSARASNGRIKDTEGVKFSTSGDVIFPLIYPVFALLPQDDYVSVFLESVSSAKSLPIASFINSIKLVSLASNAGSLKFP